MAHTVKYKGDNCKEVKYGDELEVWLYSDDNQMYLCFAPYKTRAGIKQLAWIHKNLLEGAY